MTILVWLAAYVLLVGLFLLLWSRKTRWDDDDPIITHDQYQRERQDALRILQADFQKRRNGKDHHERGNCDGQEITS